jgi:hypothetical protein
VLAERALVASGLRALQHDRVNARRERDRCFEGRGDGRPHGDVAIAKPRDDLSLGTAEGERDDVRAVTGDDVELRVPVVVAPRVVTDVYAVPLLLGAQAVRVGGDRSLADVVASRVERLTPNGRAVSARPAAISAATASAALYPAARKPRPPASERSRPARRP